MKSINRNSLDPKPGTRGQERAFQPMRVALARIRFVARGVLALAGCCLLAPASPAAPALDADYYFHRGARHFLGSNELAQAVTVVSNGLAQYPADAKLKKLWELLNQQQQQDQQNKDDKQDQSEKKDQKDQQQSKDQQSKDQQQNQQQKQQDQSSDSQKQDQSQQQQQEAKDKQEKDQQSTQPKPDEKNGDKQDAARQGKKGEQEENGEPAGGTSAQTMGVMTPQQAMQLLDAQKGDEKAMIFLPQTQRRTNRQDRVFKDW